MTTPKEFLLEMQKIFDDGDYEKRHIKADDLMMKVLSEYGFAAGVKCFQATQKWYA